MTMRPIFLASTFVLTVAASALRAGPVVIPPVPVVPPCRPCHRCRLCQRRLRPAPLDLHAHRAAAYRDSRSSTSSTSTAIREGVATAKADHGRRCRKGCATSEFSRNKGQVECSVLAGTERIDQQSIRPRARTARRVINAKGERADAAMYWKAYSLMKLARRDEALSTLGQLTKQFPDSPWLSDARALEVEVKQAAGQSVGDRCGGRRCEAAGAAGDHAHRSGGRVSCRREDAGRQRRASGSRSARCSSSARAGMIGRSGLSATLPEATRILICSAPPSAISVNRTVPKRSRRSSAVYQADIRSRRRRQ